MTGRLRIVLADDDVAVRESLEFWLTGLGHAVVPVADGGALVGACRVSLPDLVISDVHMPDGDGLAAAREVRQDGPVPVILLSGRWDDAAAASAQKAGVTRCLGKPVRPLELV